MVRISIDIGIDIKLNQGIGIGIDIELFENQVLVLVLGIDLDKSGVLVLVLGIDPGPLEVLVLVLTFSKLVLLTSDIQYFVCYKAKSSEGNIFEYFFKRGNSHVACNVKRSK